MTEIISLLIGVIVLLLGVPLGNFLTKFTKEELNSGQLWFKLLIILNLVLGFVGLIIGDDVLMFSMFFIAVVTSRSLETNKKK